MYEAVCQEDDVTLESKSKEVNATDVTCEAVSWQDDVTLEYKSEEVDVNNVTLKSVSQEDEVTHVRSSQESDRIQGGSKDKSVSSETHTEGGSKKSSLMKILSDAQRNLSVKTK